MLLRRGTRAERAEITPLARRRIDLARVEPVFARFELANHHCLLCRINVAAAAAFHGNSSGAVPLTGRIRTLGRTEATCRQHANPTATASAGPRASPRRATR